MPVWYHIHLQHILISNTYLHEMQSQSTLFVAVPAAELKLATAGDSALRQQLGQAQQAGQQHQAEMDRWIFIFAKSVAVTSVQKSFQTDKPDEA